MTAVAPAAAPRRFVLDETATQAYRDLSDGCEYVSVAVARAVRPIFLLTYRRRMVLASGSTRELPCDGHTCDAFACTLLTAPNQPEWVICVETGLLHECTDNCEEARADSTGVCPISGIRYEAFCELVDPEKRSIQSNYTLARSAEARTNSDLFMGRGEVVAQWDTLRYANVLCRAERALRGFLFSEARRRHDEKLMASARERLATVLEKYAKRGAQMGRHGVDALYVWQQVQLCARRLQDAGVCMTGPYFTRVMEHAGPAMASIAEYCAVEWMKLEERYGDFDRSGDAGYGLVDDAGGDDAGDEKAGHDAGAVAAAGDGFADASGTAADGFGDPVVALVISKLRKSKSDVGAARTPPRKKPRLVSRITHRAAAPCRALVIDGKPHFFRLHVVTCLYLYAANHPETSAFLPSVAFLMARFTRAAFDLHKSRIR